MIEVSNLDFKYDDNLVLENVNLKLEKGHIYGLVGPNGAGKTTLFNCLSSYYYPVNGSITFDGAEIENNNDYLKDMMFLDENYYIGVYSVERLLKKLSELYAKGYNDALFNELLYNLGIKRNNILSRLSKGNRKVAILCCILALEPKYLFLDEFIDGIDIVKRKYIKDKLFDYAMDREAIIVVSSHVVDDIKELCDELIIIKNKTITSNTSLDQIREKYKNYQFICDENLELEDFVNLGIEVVEFKKLNNIYWASIKGEINIDSLDNKKFKDIREMSSTLEEVLYYELSSK